ncbi:nucleic acid-binding, OB-fold protein [Tanacetum coccineum]
MDVRKTEYFNSKLKLNTVYRISNFICENTKPYQQTLQNSISLKFGKITTFEVLPGKESEFPNHHFELISYNQLPSRVPYLDEETSRMVYPILSDYLGCIRSISDLIPSGDANTGQKYRRKVDIESLDGNVVEFTMFDDLAKQFNKQEIDKLPRPVIIAVSSCRVTRYRDVQLVETPATHYYVNPRFQEASDAYKMFKEKYNQNPPLQVINYRYQDPEQEKGVRFTCDAMITSFSERRSWSKKFSTKINGTTSRLLSQMAQRLQSLLFSQKLVKRSSVSLAQIQGSRYSVGYRHSSNNSRFNKQGQQHARNTPPDVIDTIAETTVSTIPRSLADPEQIESDTTPVAATIETRASTAKRSLDKELSLEAKKKKGD